MGYIDANAHSHQIATQEADSSPSATRADIEKFKADLTWRIVIAMSVLTAICALLVDLAVGKG